MLILNYGVYRKEGETTEQVSSFQFEHLAQADADSRSRTNKEPGVSFIVEELPDSDKMPSK